jgi:hypothetical protein
VTAAQLELLGSEAETILCWRFEALVRAGYEASDAMLLASSAEVDLQAAIDLLARGCPEHVALRILL